uniref:Small ribosomal subunit protein uS8c n=1 Tax=Chlamydomonas moewusii TaxID=3054 RepID=B2X2C6_CHLMO|nr:ribosomal protein S8 [Chlamydomonas moewusii]
MVFSKKRGLINDSISDMLTRIRNATLAQKSSVNIPFTKLSLEIVKILEKEGFIQSFHFETNSESQSYIEVAQNGSSIGDFAKANDIVIRLKYNSKKLYKGKTKESCITNLRRISKPGLRIYVNSREIPRILSGTGIAIISTPSGLMSDREARARKLGGELLCSVW